MLYSIGSNAQQIHTPSLASHDAKGSTATTHTHFHPSAVILGPIGNMLLKYMDVYINDFMVLAQ
jgi:hypothetical protein